MSSLRGCRGRVVAGSAVGLLLVAGAGCSSPSTSPLVVGAARSFSHMVMHGDIDDLDASDQFDLRINPDDLAKSQSGLQCVLVHVKVRDESEDREYLLVKYPGDSDWELATTDESQDDESGSGEVYVRAIP